MRGIRSGDTELRKALLPIAATFVQEQLSASIREALKESDPGVCAAAGRRLCSFNPSKPLSLKRSRHLYPVFALIPYSRHSSRKLGQLTAFIANSIR